MWIRFREWQQISDSAEVHVSEIGFHRYFFWKKDDGVCDVRVKADALKLLSPKNSAFCAYELAYEKYGIEWDSNGNQKDSPQPASSEMREAYSDTTHPPIAISGGSTFTTTTVESKPKMTVMERMAKARAARQEKKLNGTYA